MGHIITNAVPKYFSAKVEKYYKPPKKNPKRFCRVIRIDYICSELTLIYRINSLLLTPPHPLGVAIFLPYPNL